MLHSFVGARGAVARGYSSFITIGLILLTLKIFSLASSLEASGENAKQKMIAGCAKAQSTALVVMNAPEMFLRFSKRSAVEAANSAVKQVDFFLFCLILSHHV